MCADGGTHEIAPRSGVAFTLGRGDRLTVIDPRGETYSDNNIEERLAIRKFMEEMRASGVATGGPAPYSAADGKAFADRLDRLLTKHRIANERR